LLALPTAAHASVAPSSANKSSFLTSPPDSWY
jgi:hypothetical protein